MNYGYDHVGIQMAGGGYNLVSREEFLRIPLNERIHLILRGKVQFIRDGTVIPVMEALGKAPAAAGQPETD